MESLFCYILQVFTVYCLTGSLFCYILQVFTVYCLTESLLQYVPFAFLHNYLQCTSSDKHIEIMLHLRQFTVHCTEEGDKDTLILYSIYFISLHDYLLSVQLSA